MKISVLRKINNRVQRESIGEQENPFNQERSFYLHATALSSIAHNNQKEKLPNVLQ